MRLEPPTIEGKKFAASKVIASDGELPLLVIEDEDSVQSFLSAALKKHGYATVIASSGMEGLRLLQERDFRAVISDIRIPGEINVAEVREWIGMHRPQLLSRMLFMTGDSSGAEVARLIGKTGVPCLEKPFRLNELMTALNRVLES
jgi:DNA-binding NtrC family response regulator